MGDGSFDWRSYLKKPKFIAAPVSCFKHVALSDCWDSVVSNVYVEIRSPDCKTCCTTNPCRYWIAHVTKVAGYMGLLQFVGFEQQAGQRWINLCTEPHIHPVGWCSDNRKPLVPPKCIEDKYDDWKTLLVNRMSGFCTLPANFRFKDVELSNNLIKKGMKLEVVDKNLISVVRPAKVSEVVGGRLHVVYLDSEMEDEGFWCHERSPLIHPVGWAQIIGHALKGTKDYANDSLHKTLYRKFEPDDATWDMFLPVINPVRELRFKPGMKLEAIDPLNLSTICVATVTEVLRNNYLMIGIDGMMAANGADCFCYHASSPCIFPVGFCEEHDIILTPPRVVNSMGIWRNIGVIAKLASLLAACFGRQIWSTICVATVTEVLRNNYLMIGIEGMMAANGADCFCYHASSPCIFPVGFCEEHDIALTPPRGYKGEFKWSEYLKKTKSEAAPVDLFHRVIPDHGFKENMYLEAVDLMEPRLICVAYITKVVGRLLRVHFEGWEDDYDQWCDCESPDLFPVGWCDVLGYKLEPPRVDPTNEEKKKKKPGKRRRRRGKSKKVSDEEDDIDGDDDDMDESADGDIIAVNAEKKSEPRFTRRKVTNGSAK